MPELTLADVQHEFYELYRTQAYSDILALLDNNAGLFSDRGVFTFYNWKMCAAALNGDTPLALAILRDALDNGAYWSEKMYVATKIWPPFRATPNLSSWLRLAMPTSWSSNKTPNLSCSWLHLPVMYQRLIRG